MRALAKFFSCGIFCIFSFYAMSQQAGFSTKIVFFPDTSYLGASDTFSIRVKNLNTTTYSGFINIYVSVDTVAFSVASLCSLPSITIPPLDSVFIPCNITFDSAYFNAGNNIVVVWSSGNAVTPADSAWDNVYLKTTGMGMNEHQNDFSFSLYPSYVNAFLHLDFQKTNSLLEKIRIMDVFGREIMCVPILKQENKNFIDVSHLSNGIYLLEARFRNFISTKKFIKTD